MYFEYRVENVYDVVCQMMVDEVFLSLPGVEPAEIREMVYVISVRRTKSLLTASFKFYLTIDTLAVQLYTSLSPRRVRDFHPLERAHGAQTKISCRTLMRQLMPLLFINNFI